MPLFALDSIGFPLILKNLKEKQREQIYYKMLHNVASTKTDDILRSSIQSN